MMASDTATAGSLELGLAHHRSGNLAAAADIYRTLLADNPRHADALHLLGLAEDAIGRTGDAIRMLRQAASIRPAPTTLANLSALLTKAGQLDEALAAAGRAIALQPDNSEAFNNLGVALLQRDLLEEAARAFARAVELRPDYADALRNQAEALNKSGQHHEAIRPLEQAVEMAPLRVELIGALADTLRLAGRHAEAVLRWRAAAALDPANPGLRNNLAAALAEADQPAEAVLVLQDALARFPDFISGHTNLAHALLNCRRFGEAEAVARTALQLQPDSADARLKLGLSLRAQNRLLEAEEALRQAVALSPGSGTLSDHAVAQHELGWLQETLVTLERALDYSPGDAELLHHKALTLLELGRMTEGWDLYDSRFRTKQAKKQGVSPPGAIWRGEDLPGGTLLLRAEQGLGDTIQFARYATLAASRAGRVILDAPATLHRLLARIPGVVELVGPNANGVAFQAQCPLLSLPRAFGTTLDNIPAGVPYLTPPEDALAAWRDRFGGTASRRVAVVWAGNPIHPNDAHRSLPFAQLAPLWDVPGIDWFSVQIGEHVADLAQAPLGRITDLSPWLTDMAETAAALMHMDLVIAADTSVAHLAGALGRPTWLLLPFAPDWRWLRDREDTPWYPSMRLFRQMTTGDWKMVVTRVARAL
jgi:tetratricopeptide (TPR) repeat protein